MKTYQVHYEAGSFAGPGGATRLNDYLTAYCGKGVWEIVTVLPIIKSGNIAGVQIVIRSTADA